MLHKKSESDCTSLTPSCTSLTPSSSTSPKRAAYFVQSPSRDSHDGDKSSTNQATPTFNSSPMDSPSHPSTFDRSRDSSASRVSGSLQSKFSRIRNGKRWSQCNVITEEGDYDEYLDEGYKKRCQVLIVFMAFAMVFTVFCLIIWGASRTFEPRVSVQSLTVNNFYSGEGSDYSGVPTKMLTVNCSLRMIIQNPATFFGIHVSVGNINLLFSELTIASGQLIKYYQPRESKRAILVRMEGRTVPLYGAGASFAAMDKNGGVPLKLEFDVGLRGKVIGNLVKTEHHHFISCPLVIDSKITRFIRFKNTSCSYN